MRVAIISRHPAPYRDSFLARICRRDDVQVDVFNELPLDKGHTFWNLSEHGYLARVLFPSDAGWVSRFLSLLKNFVFGSYDLVLWPGFLTPEITLAAFIGALVRRRYGFAADTVSQGEIRGVRKWVKNLIVSRATLIFVPGDCGASFWRKEYGIPIRKIVKGMYALDGIGIEREIGELRRSRDEIRTRYGLSFGDTVFLMVANMIPTRNYPITAEAFVRFANGRRNFKLVIVGSGPDLPRMQAFANGHLEIVVLNGVPFQEMLSLYAMADVYVHGGSEPASTALVIGAIAKLPLVSTKKVGCFFDVVQDGVSGVDAKDPDSVADLEDAFTRIEALRDRWQEMGVSARELSKSIDVENVVEEFVKVLEGE